MVNERNDGLKVGGSKWVSDDEMKKVEEGEANAREAWDAVEENARINSKIANVIMKHMNELLEQFTFDSSHQISKRIWYIPPTNKDGTIELLNVYTAWWQNLFLPEKLCKEFDAIFNNEKIKPPNFSFGMEIRWYSNLYQIWWTTLKLPQWKWQNFYEKFNDWKWNIDSSKYVSDDEMKNKEGPKKDNNLEFVIKDWE